MLWFMGLQRVGHDRVTELTEITEKIGTIFLFVLVHFFFDLLNSVK